MDGLQARIFVNDRDTGVDVLVPPGKGNSSPFDANLGLLNAGDTIYVAIGVGPGEIDFSSSFYLKYQIDLAPVPEPSSFSCSAPARSAFSVTAGQGVAWPKGFGRTEAEP